jgi:very-short-patch-repair endonuclease
MDSEITSTADDLGKSVFQSDLPLESKLEKARTELLDLSARNRLLNIPRSAKSAKILEIVDENSREIFRLLVREQKPFTFVPGKSASGKAIAEDESDEIADLVQPEDDGIDDRGVANRHADTRLQTRLTPPGLQKRLLDLYFDAQTLEEEQGVNILFLALGTLKWIDPNNAANIRYAPLILVPVSLERGNAAEKFKLRWRLEDVAPNLSLEAYLARVHGLKLPTFEAGDDFDTTAYAASVADAISAKPGWAVMEDDIVLGFFSFAKFLMYRDLDPDVWPAGSKLTDHGLVRPLVSEGFADEEPLLPEDAFVDAHISPAEMVHIVDCDSSQTLAVHEARRGRNLVIQGPPGTGKSQTIANIIASAVADGKTVLFVAEKMAALEVVKRRLDNTGVGDACLELHSNKANKRAVLEDLRRTWELGAPRGDDLKPLNARLVDARDKLTTHAVQLHLPLGRAGFTPYGVIGHLTRLKQAGYPPNDIALDGAADWSAEDLRERIELLQELADRVIDIGLPASHVWRGIELESALPPDVDRLVLRIEALCRDLDALRDEGGDIAALLETDAPATLDGFHAFQKLAHRLAEAPDLEPSALGSPSWAWEAQASLRLLETGERYLALASRLNDLFKPQAWAAGLAPIREALAALPGDMPVEGFARATLLADKGPLLQREALRLAKALGRDVAPVDLRGIDELVRVGERVAAAPDADPNAFAADLWDAGVERAADLAAAVETVESSRAEVGTELNAAAWSAELAATRATLAAHGTSFLRIFSGDWRAADRLARSYLVDPKAPLKRRMELLDAVTRAQGAIASIKADDEFGRSAFGADWRGDRSVGAPLISLVEWMRSLRGLGAEPRLIAGRHPDRELLRTLTQSVAELAQGVREALQGLWVDLEAAKFIVFGEAASFERGDLINALAAATRLSEAHSGYVALALQVDPNLERVREALALLEDGQTTVTELGAGSDLGQTLFGDQWNGQKSDFPKLKSAAVWIVANLDIHALASRTTDRAGLVDQIGRALMRREDLLGRLDKLLEDVAADSTAAIQAASAKSGPVADLADALTAWCERSEELSKWVAYRSRARQADGLGLSDMVQRLHDGRLPPGLALPHFEMAFFELVFAWQVKAVPALGQFDGDLHDNIVRSFVDLDRQRIQHAALEVMRAHHRAIPPKSGGALGPLGVLKGEIARKRGHMPIRQLMQKAAPAVQALKPVFMMSPLSVAQYLPPGGLIFDLLVMDEASQIQPVDALGAIARCRQVVVVGDPQQLPPTAFFAKVTGNNDDTEEDDGAKVADIESILGLFTARGLPMRMLRWHYRSRHQSLIAVSNRQFYEDKLYIVPSPYSAQAGLGLRFHYIVDGIFETGTTRTNPVEAKVVARAVIDHAINSPGESLGVVAFSAAQRRAIQDQLEVLRRQLPPEQEAFFQAHSSEPFFIKNLENVQGDERDVIFISVGYGPTAKGLKPPMRFGPLGQEGGERRLNVLISRAKRRCEVFSSMTDEDIEADFASTRKGVFALKLFMHFARTGRMTLAESAGQDRDDVFEAQVTEALHARGFQVHRQVGVSGIFIDVAVVDPDRPERYLLAVECDGAAYHGAKSTRDRDRLRRAVLEDHGWFVHRIWSTDWFRRPKEQLERLIALIEAAKAELAAQGARTNRPRTPPTFEIQAVDRETVTEMGLVGVEEAAPASAMYVEAVLSLPSHLTCELHEAPIGILSMLAEQVVTVEGPVHIDEIVVRVREAWGLKRAGGRIQDAVRRAIALPVRQRRVVQQGEFFWVQGSAPLVRDRSFAHSPSLRRPEALPPNEIGVALVDVVLRNFGATEDQAVQAVSRALGFKATSTQLRDVILGVLNTQLDVGVLVRRETLIDVGPNAPARERRLPEPSPLEALVAEGEHAQLEFKESLRWDVRQGAVNKKLEDVVIKTVAALANHNGGTLLIGVSDVGEVVGIEPDVACLGGNRDKFELHLTNLLSAQFSESFKATKIRVSFPQLAGKMICRIDVQRSREAIYVKLPDRSGAMAERLFVRSGNASHEIPPSQIAGFVREHFA